MRDTSSSARALLAALAVALIQARVPAAALPNPAAAAPGSALPSPSGALALSGDAAPSPEQVASVKDGFDWADGIISALAVLAPPLAPSGTVPGVAGCRHCRPRRVRPRRPASLPLPAFVGRRLLLHKSTVFGIFDLTVSETSPRSFDLIVGSAEPAENIQVRDRFSRAVLVDQALDDERVFRVRVPEALSPRIVVEVSLAQADEIDRAYFPLLGDAQK